MECSCPSTVNVKGRHLTKNKRKNVDADDYPDPKTASSDDSGTSKPAVNVDNDDVGDPTAASSATPASVTQLGETCEFES
jgi:hypothetical protein